MVAELPGKDRERAEKSEPSLYASLYLSNAKQFFLLEQYVSERVSLMS